MEQTWPDPLAVQELQEMAVAGERPHRIAEALWNGVADHGNVRWIMYMRAAFEIPIGDLKSCALDVTPEGLDKHLTPWINAFVRERRTQG